MARVVKGTRNPAAEQLGAQLLTLRKRLSKSQRQMASYLDIHDSTWARMEMGILKPRSWDFFERLKQIPGVTESDVQRLRTAADLPPIFEGGAVQQVHAQTEAHAAAGGFSATVALAASPMTGADEAEVAQLKSVVEGYLSLLLQNYVRERAEARDHARTAAEDVHRQEMSRLAQQSVQAHTLPEVQQEVEEAMKSGERFLRLKMKEE